MNNNERMMSKPEAVHIIMDMMCNAKNEFEVDALALACRTMIKRWKDSKKNRALKRSMCEPEKMEVK